MQQPDDWTAGVKQGCLLALAVLITVLPHTHGDGALSGRTSTGYVHHDLQLPMQRRLELGAEPASREVLQLAQWVVDAADNGARAFVILDKKDARAFVFEASGRLLGASPVLLGYAMGDDNVAGIGKRPIAEVKPEERTTPAGRFVAQPGRNTLHEQVLWVDYDAAVSMHRVRLTDPRERRMERLASPAASERRISYGCINMPVAFFDDVLWPSLGRQGGIVYVLPEVKPLLQVFPQLAPNTSVALRHLT